MVPPPVSTGGVGVTQAGDVERYQPPHVVPEASGASVGPTPPANPRPGASWFDGSALQIWDGAAWNAVGGGGSLSLPLAVVDGGTGATTAAAARTALGVLPLAGGTLTAMNAGGVGLTLAVDANTATGITLTTSAFNAVGLRVNANGSGTNSMGINVVNSGVNGIAARNMAGTDASSIALSAINTAGAGTALLVDNPSADGGLALEIRRSNAGASAASIRMRSTSGLSPLGQEFGAVAFAGNIAPGGIVDGAVIAASATSAWTANTRGGTQLDFKVAPAGSGSGTAAEVVMSIGPARSVSLWDGAAMVVVSFGAADSGGTGFRQLVVPN